MSTKVPTNMTPEEWYKNEKQIVDKAAQQQYEEAYVNRELMNKYLKQNLAEQGLANTGMANLYAQQNNTNYMNQRANIAQAQQQSEQSLYDLYSQKKEKQFNDNSAATLESYLSQLAEAENAYGYIDDEKLSELTGGFDPNMLNSTDRLKYETAYKGYVGTEEEKKAKAQDEFYTDMQYGMYENNRAGNITIDEWYKQAEDAYANGDISREQYYEITDWIAEKEAPYKEIEQNNVMITFTDELTYAAGDDGMLTDAQIKEQKKKLEEIRPMIGEDNYKAAMTTIDSMKETKAQTVQKTITQQYPYVDASNYVDLETANTNSFGDFASEGGKQSEYVTNIINILNTPGQDQIKNGDIIDFNYGNNAFNQKAGLYMYYEGKLYKVNDKKRKDANITSEGINGHTTQPTRQK